MRDLLLWLGSTALGILGVTALLLAMAGIGLLGCR